MIKVAKVIVDTSSNLQSKNEGKTFHLYSLLKERTEGLKMQLREWHNDPENSARL